MSYFLLPFLPLILLQALQVDQLKKKKISLRAVVGLNYPKNHEKSISCPKAISESKIWL